MAALLGIVALVGFWPSTSPPVRLSSAGSSSSSSNYASASELRRSERIYSSAQIVQQVEVLPPPSPPMLSDASVSRVLEMVWRDTRKVASEYKFGDMGKTITLFLKGDVAEAKATPLFAELVRDRIPILKWYLVHKADLTQLAVVDWMDELGLPVLRDELQLCRNELRSRLDEQKRNLWPTLRALLLTERIHRRVVQAAQAQLLLARGEKTGSASLAVNILTSPRRFAMMWFAGLKALHYGLKWVWTEFGLKWVLSPCQRQRLRARLIERAIIKGLDLQRRVEDIEAQAEALRGTGGSLPPLWQTLQAPP